MFLHSIFCIKQNTSAYIFHECKFVARDEAECCNYTIEKQVFLSALMSTVQIRVKYLIFLCLSVILFIQTICTDIALFKHKLCGRYNSFSVKHLFKAVFEPI